eukprot:TRINITY_DN3047_c2_g1_i1.p1 TRINITY_DN3047_c2_g1~~TRINITY_DN3047_c2_g1_i1.p1  ORF type:complete len:543 (+),score=111.40 TRINITY_DN3047_c2_g1_i1:232-1860(+)
MQLAQPNAQAQGQPVLFNDAMWMNPFHTSPFHPLSSTITISVQGLAADVTLRDLREKFSKYGKTLRVWCVEGSEHGMVTYRHTSEAEAAIRGEFNAQFKGEDIKVAPSMYSAAAPCSVKPGDEKYWRCFLCHNTNRSITPNCSAYKCGYTKEESDKEWAETDLTMAPSTVSKRWELAKLMKDLMPDSAPRSMYTVPHCLIVMNLLSSITDQQIRRVFLRYGQINQIRLLMPVDGDRTVEAQVVFEDSDALEQAAEYENGKQISPQHRVRAHRGTFPFVLAVVPGHPFGINGSELSEALQMAFSEFGIVKEVEVGQDMCTVSVFTLRTVRLAILHLNNKRMLFERPVSVYLLNCEATKWPCLNCCNINPPGVQCCLDCNTVQPDFSMIHLPKAWSDAIRKRTSDFKAKDAGKGRGRHHQNYHNGKGHEGGKGHHDRGHKGAGHHADAHDDGDPNVLDMLQKAASGPGMHGRRHREDHHGYKGGHQRQHHNRHYPQGGFFNGKGGGPCVACGLKSFLLCKCCNSFFCNEKCQNAIIHPKQVLRN